MNDQQTLPPGTVPRAALIVMILLAGGLMLSHLAGFAGGCWVMALGVAITEGGMAAMIILAAGGYAFPLIRRLSGDSAPLGLRVVTASALGLWMLSTAMLVLGTAFGLFNSWFWWVLVAAGVLLAAWQGRRKLETWKPPARYGGRSLLWVLIALAAGLWLAGAARAPGSFSTTEQYDVLEYHLQVPREFHDAGRISELEHNCYSYYPLGVEMLFLIGTCLRGGAYEGMYLAKILHGTFGVLAVAGVFLALKKDEETRARFAAGLLATIPMALYLSYMAMVELAEICYLVLALLWLREHFRTSSWKPAACVGLMLGASCSVKYLSVGFIVAPILLVMIVAAIRKPARLARLPLVGLLTLLPFSPWLIRNTAYTGNLVFPLATEVFGRGHWSEESNRRWVDGHSPEPRPPVPEPAGWEPRPQPGRAELFFHNFLVSHLFSPIMLTAAVVAIAVMIADKKRPDPWDIALLATCAVQLAIWIFATRDMPPRFILPAAAPISLLAAGALAKLARVEVNPFRRSSIRPAHGPWGLAPAAVIFVAAAGVGLVVNYRIFQTVTRGLPAPPWPGSEIATLAGPYKHAAELPQGSKILLVGEARPFYFPPGTVYATAFDEHPLASLAAQPLTAAEVHRRLRDRGITHVWVSWEEILRLATSYGYPKTLSEDLLRRWRAEPRQAPEIPILADLVAAGLLERTLDVPFPEPEENASDSKPATQAASQPATLPESLPARPRRRWPIATIYTLAGDAAAATRPGASTTSRPAPPAHRLSDDRGAR